MDTKLDTSIFNTQIATKADLSSLQATNTTLTQKANQTDVDTSLALKADLSALNSTNTTLTTKANITDMNSALALKVDTTDLDAINTSLTSKAPQTSLDTTNTNLGTLTTSLSALTTQVNNSIDPFILKDAGDASNIPEYQLPGDLYLAPTLTGHRPIKFEIGTAKFDNTDRRTASMEIDLNEDAGGVANDASYVKMSTNAKRWAFDNGGSALLNISDSLIYHSVPISQTSDGRAKTNNQEIRSGLDAVLRLKPQTYKKDGKTESGFITQEVLEIPELKHLVSVPENENELQSLNYTGIISYLVSAIQELNNKLN